MVILTIFTDAKVISVYTVYYLVIGKIKNIMQSFTNGLEAAFGNMWAKKEMDAIQRNFRIFEFFMFSFVAIIFSCVGVLIIPFVSEYTKGITDVNYIRYSLAGLITITEAVYCVRQPYLTLVQATGFYKETKNGAMLEALINIVSSIILVQFININGVIVGTLIANTFRTIQYALFISKNVLQRSIFEVVKRTVWLLITTLIIVLFSDFLTPLILLEGWFGWLVKALITFALSFIVTVVMSFIFYRGDLIQLVSMGQRMILSKQRTR